MLRLVKRKCAVFTMSNQHHVVLVPGFFGFERLGNLRYFEGVSEVLHQEFAARGESLMIHEVRTMPTASIRYRAACVLEELVQVCQEHEGHIHLIGHSTGGLDARLAIAPTASLATPVHDDEVYRRVQSVVTIATPHEGTPLASFFAGAMGKPLLKLVAATLAMALDRGRLPLQVVVRLGEMLTAAGGVVGLRASAIEKLYDSVLRDFPEENRQALLEIWEEVATDASLVFQLTADAIDIFNAATAHPLDACYGSVVLRGRRPHIWALKNHGSDPYAQVMYILYRFIHKACAGGKYSQPSASQSQPLRNAFGGIPSPDDSDGIVPTLSQLWGEVVCAVNADHLDVIGHHGDGIHAGSDWIPSDSGFGHDEFVDVWQRVARFVIRAAQKRSAA